MTPPWVVAQMQAPLWVKALAVRATERLSTSLHLPPESVWQASLGWDANAIRKKEARALYVAFPHTSVLARELNVSPEAFRYWVKAAGGEAKRRTG